jgi:NitT/TauT family transport system permease protein
MYFQVGANLQFSRLEVFRFIIFPICLPSIVLALRLALGISWMVVVAAEMIAVRSGLGYLIMDGRNALRLDYVMVAMIVIGLLGLLLDRMMTGVERIEALRWNLERK